MRLWTMRHALDDRTSEIHPLDRSTRSRKRGLPENRMSSGCSTGFAARDFTRTTSPDVGLAIFVVGLERARSLKAVPSTKTRSRYWNNCNIKDSFSVQCASGSTMSLATPTLVPRPSVFPHLLPKASQPYPTPLPNRRVYAHLNARRDLQREMDDLSDEENEVEDIVSHLNSASAHQSCQCHFLQTMFVRNRGFNTMIPIGRLLTQQEEKNDVRLSVFALIVTIHLRSGRGHGGVRFSAFRRRGLGHGR